MGRVLPSFLPLLLAAGCATTDSSTYPDPIGAYDYGDQRGQAPLVYGDSGAGGGVYEDARSYYYDSGPYDYSIYRTPYRSGPYYYNTWPYGRAPYYHGGGRYGRPDRPDRDSSHDRGDRSGAARRVRDRDQQPKLEDSLGRQERERSERRVPEVGRPDRDRNAADDVGRIRNRDPGRVDVDSPRSRESSPRDNGRARVETPRGPRDVERGSADRPSRSAPDRGSNDSGRTRNR